MTERRAEGLLLLVTLVAAAGWVFSKQALQDFAPYSFLGQRFLLAALVLGLFARRQLMSLSADQLKRCLLMGVLFSLALTVWILALSKIEAIGEGAFLVSLAVVFVPLIGRVFFGELLTRRLLLAIVPAVLGLALLSLDNGLNLSLAQLLFLLSALGFALHLNLSNYFVQGIPPLALATIQLAMVGVVALGLAFALEDFSGLMLGELTIATEAWWWLLASAVIATSWRFSLQTEALQHISPSHASVIFLAEPVWTALLGAWLLGERMSVAQLAGCGMIFTALLIYRLPLPSLTKKFG